MTDFAPDTALVELEDRSLSWPARASNVVVASQTDLDGAAGLLQDIKALRAEIAATFDPIDRAQIEARRVTIAQRKALEGPLIVAEAVIRSKAAAYVSEQERLARAQAALEEAAARESRMKAEAAAQELEALGEPELADGLREEAAVDSAPPILAPAPKAAGLSFPERWKCEVTDLRALVAAVAAGQVPLRALKADEVFLGQQARSLHKELSYPGVRVWSEKGATVR